MDCPDKFSTVGIAQIKEEPSLDDEIFMHSTDYEALIQDAFVCKEEIDINWDDNNDNIDTINDNQDNSPKQNSIIKNNIRLTGMQVNSQRNEFLNITDPTSSISAYLECPSCSKVLRNKRSLANHLRSCKRKCKEKFSCSKCPFITSNTALLKFHNDDMHLPRVCPKCTTVCENKKSFIRHFNQFCNEKAMKISCSKCTYKCNTELMLKDHVNLMHSVKPEMQAKKLTTPNRFKRITSNNTKVQIIKLGSAKSLYSKDFNNVAEKDHILKSLPPKVQSKATKQNTVVKKVSEIVNKDYYEIDEIVAETKQHKKNPINNSGKAAKVTKICEECDTETQFDIANNCIKCNRDSIFRCNQCFKTFPNYQKASYHLWTECNLNGIYYCLKCDFTSPYKFRVLNHCNEHHPEIHDPLESAVEADFIEFREFNSKTQKADITVFKCPLCDLQFKESVDYKIHFNDCCTMHVKEQNVNTDAVHLLKKTRLNVAASIGTDLSKNNSRLDINKVSKSVTQYCAKCNKSTVVEPDNFRFLHSCESCNDRGHMSFKCSKCNKIYKNYERVRRHLKNSCYLELLKCSKCDYEDTIFNLKKHSQQAHNDFCGPCQYCGKIFGDSVGYNNHLNHCSKPFNYSCDDCLFETDSKINLKKHILSAHWSIPMVKVDFALKQCRSYSGDRYKDSTNYLQGYCTNCCGRSSLKFRSKKCIKCKGILNFICRVCGRSSKIDDAEACEHVKIYLELLKFECFRCGKGYSSRDRLEVHMTSCTKRFSKENERNASTSSSSKSFSLENKRNSNKSSCGKIFSVEEKQDNQTIPCETTPEPYTCQFCNYVSSSKAHVERHERYKHLEDLKKLYELNPPRSKIFQCNVCSCEYTKIDNVRLHILRRHVKNKSKIQPCEKCNYDFKGSHGLRKHLAYCGKKLYMPCRVNLTRIKLKPVDSRGDSPVTIKEEIIDPNDFEIKMEM